MTGTLGILLLLLNLKNDRSIFLSFTRRMTHLPVYAFYSQYLYNRAFGLRTYHCRKLLLLMLLLEGLVLEGCGNEHNFCTYLIVVVSYHKCICLSFVRTMQQHQTGGTTASFCSVGGIHRAGLEGRFRSTNVGEMCRE